MSKLTGNQIMTLGYPQGPIISLAINEMALHFKHKSEGELLQILQNVYTNYTSFLEDVQLAKLANACKKVHEQNVLNEKIALYKKGIAKALFIDEEPAEIALNPIGISYSIFGAEHIEDGALKQMEIAAKLPIAVAGALMPDAHQGYGLPIGGVLATNNAIIPYAVGVDIGCRMCLSIFAIEPSELKKREAYFQRELVANTLFGAGREFTNNDILSTASDIEILDRSEFKEIPFLATLHFKAKGQLGSSGSGNHFVEFGKLEITDANNPMLVPLGEYVGLLTHSGSRGLGANIAAHYTKIAMQNTPLPKDAKHLAWLDLNTQAGNEYWLAMNLAGDYASACHHTIHQKIAKAIGEKPLAMVENHHNFAWKEMYEGKEVIVHRKGATPAGKNVLGIIPGSMTAPGFIVKGKGEPTSINSASHGAGRKMSRTKAMANITYEALQKELANYGVKLIGGGLDEAPFAYKNIDQVMQSQTELVDVLGKFYPAIVQMDGSKPRKFKYRKVRVEGE